MLVADISMQALPLPEPAPSDTGLAAKICDAANGYYLVISQPSGTEAIVTPRPVEMAVALRMVDVSALMLGIPRHEVRIDFVLGRYWPAPASHPA